MRPLKQSLLALLMLCALSANAKMLISTGGWPPFLTPDQKHFGFIAHLISDVFAQVGIDVDYQQVPWRRAYVSTVAGKYDGTAVWMDLPDRHQDFLYSDPVLDERFVFFHRADQTFEWETLSDLSDLKLAGVIGYSYGAAFEAAMDASVLNVEWVATEESVLQMLLAGRIDAYPQEISVGYYTIMSAATPSEAALITHHPKPLLVNQSYLLLPRSLPDSAARLQQFNAQLRIFKESGRYQSYFDAFEAGKYDLEADDQGSNGLTLQN